MDNKNLKLIAFDLDGTLTQHKSRLDEKNKRVLDLLSKKYKLLMVGAGSCRRIFEQMGRYPIDIIGNYGFQYAKYNPDTKDIDIVTDVKLPVDRESVSARVQSLREKYAFTEYKGDSVQFHDSGCITFAILGTEADLADKLAFDPTREKRRKIFSDVKKVFSDYTVFVGGSSSFDMAPYPYDKAYALSEYCKEAGISHSEVLFVGDDYGEGGNDESVYLSDFNFLKIDDYTTLEDKFEFLLKEIKA